jgi:hypothetical protein
MESEVYSVKFEVYSREFKGQSSSSSIGSRIITGNCLESFKEGIWNIARHVLKREVIINLMSSSLESSFPSFKTNIDAFFFPMLSCNFLSSGPKMAIQFLFISKFCSSFEIFKRSLSKN